MPGRLPPPPARNTPPRIFTERDYGYDVYHGYENTIRHSTTSVLSNVLGCQGLVRGYDHVIQDYVN